MQFLQKCIPGLYGNVKLGGGDCVCSLKSKLFVFIGNMPLLNSVAEINGRGATTLVGLETEAS